jgi:hypothetical protein
MVRSFTSRAPPIETVAIERIIFEAPNVQLANSSSLLQTSIGADADIAKHGIDGHLPLQLDFPCRAEISLKNNLPCVAI